MMEFKDISTPAESKQTAEAPRTEEIDALNRVLNAPERPVVAVLGGAKLSSKISVLKNLVGKLDAVIIGGGMANTFLYSQGAPMGLSLYEENQVATVREIEALAEISGCRILLPSDVVTARTFKANAKTKIVPADKCPKDAMILDAGPRAVSAFEAELADARTILWNGPLGAFEIKPFDRSTVHLARAVADMTRQGLAVSIAGGRGTVAALNEAEIADDFTHVSTAGGAFLQWLEGRTLAGIAAIMHTPLAA